MKKIILLILFLPVLLFGQHRTRNSIGDFQYIDSTTGDSLTVDVTDSVFTIEAYAFRIDSVTTTQRDALTAVNGMAVYNHTQNQYQAYANGAWINLGAGAGGGISNVVEDLTPQSGGDWDMNAFDLQFDDADGIHDSNDNEQLIFQLTGSAVNYIEITNAATAGEPLIQAVGSDTDVSLTLDGQGAGTVRTLSSNLDITGNIVVSGTVDGINIATDVAANTTHAADNTQAHSDYLLNNAADEMLLADATTNVVTDILDLSHTGGTVAAGFGTGIRFDLEDAGGIEEQASIDVSLDVVTDAAEEASIIFRHNVAGTIQESMRIDGTLGYVGIGTANPQENLHVVGEIFLVHTATAADEHALEIDVDAAGFGDVKGLEIEYDTGAMSSGSVSSAILIDINDIDATGGDIIGLEILSTDGGSDNVVGIKIGAELAPLVHDSGSFANPTLGTNNTNTTNVPDMIDGSTGTNTTIFAADNDFIIYGADAAYTQLEFVIETGFGNPGIQPVFAFSTSGTNQFTNFTPTDGTDGFKSAGAFVVAWDADEVPGHVADDVTGKFDIRITRTANPAGSVSLFYAKSAATRTFGIDKSGNIRFLTYIFEGATDDANEHTLNVIDPTADRLFNFPDDQLVAGDVLVASDASDLEYLNLANNELLFGDGAGIPTAAVLSGHATNALGVVTIVDFALTSSADGGDNNITNLGNISIDGILPDATDITAMSAGGDFIIGGGATASNLRLLEASGSGTNFTQFVVVPQAGNITYSLPPDDGDSGEVLQTNGTGGLTWEADATGGSTVWSSIGNPTNSGLTTITFDNAETSLLTGNNDAAVSFLTLQNTDADHTGGNIYILDLDYSADDGDPDADFIRFQDSGGTVMTIQQNGVIATDGTIDAGGAITAVGSFIIGSADMSEVDLEKLDGITDGAGAANKALVLDASSNIASGLANLTASATVTVPTVLAGLLDPAGAVDLDLGSADVTDVRIETDGGVVVIDGNITQDAGTTLFAGGLIDATGAVDMDYGSADITDHTFIADGMTDADFVVPFTSISGAEIVNDTITPTQLDETANYTWSGTHDFGGASLEITNSDDPTTSATIPVAYDNNNDAIEVFDAGRSDSYLIGHVRTFQRTISFPDTLEDNIPNLNIWRIEALEFPFGILIHQVAIQLEEDAAYSMVFEEWSGDPLVAQADIETVTTGASDTYAEDSAITNNVVDADDTIVLDIPDTNVDLVQIIITYSAIAGN